MANRDQTAYYNPKKCYFWFNCFGIDFEYPSVETYVYLGNASEMQDKIPTKEGFLYFQDAESYANHGFLNAKRHKLEEGEMRIWEISEARAEKELLDFDGLIRELKKCKKSGL